MRLLKTGRQVTQAVKNAQRLRVILGTLAKYGFEGFLLRMGLDRYLPATTKEAGIENLSVAERLRRAIESLGPTFVKLGQLLANRPDMVPDDIVEEFKKLQDSVTPVPFDLLRGVVEQELGGKLEDHFKNFNPQPMASASIGQVHEATLHSGETVVVKIQRPDIEKTIKNDISVLSFLAGLMERYVPEAHILSPVQIVDEFFRTLTFELDFVLEANNMSRIAENLRDNPRVVIPRVYRKQSTRRVLTLQKLNGHRITDVQKLKADGISASELVDAGARAFFKMVLIDGLFHGDLHGGNLLALKNPQTGESQIGVLDFGIVGRLSQRSRDTLSTMVVSLLSEDYETLCYEYAELSAVEHGVDFDTFQREVRNTISPYMGSSLKDLNLGALLISSTQIAVKHKIKVPSDWMLVFKAIFTIEGLGRQLDPDFDFLAVGHEMVKSVLKDRYSLDRVSRDLTWILRDVNSLVQILPRQIRWMFRKFNSNDFAVEIKFKETEVLRRQLEMSFRSLGIAVMTSGMFLASALSLQMKTDHFIWGQYPVPSIIFFFAGCAGLLRFIVKSWR